MSDACIRPDPDIGGIGVRIGFYIQAACSIVIGILLFVRSNTKQDGRAIFTSYIFMYLLTLALLWTCFVKSTAGALSDGVGLSAYHAVIAFYLACIILLSNVFCTSGGVCADKDDDTKGRILLYVVLAFAIILAIGTYIFGIRHWIRLDGSFGPYGGTPPSIACTDVWTSGGIKPIANAASDLKAFSSLILVWVIIQCIVQLVVHAMYRSKGEAKWPKRILFIANIVTIIMILVSLIVIEKTVQANKEHFDEKLAGGTSEADWGFGQVLAVTVAVANVLQVIYDALKKTD